MPSVLFAAIVVFMTSSGWPSVVTSNMFNPAPSNKLLNLTGFFSSLPVPGVADAGRADIVVVLLCYFLRRTSGRTEASVRLRCLECELLLGIGGVVAEEDRRSLVIYSVASWGISWGLSFACVFSREAYLLVT